MNQNPKITRLSQAIAEALAALVDLANDGADMSGLVAPKFGEVDESIVLEPKARPTPAADVQPATRKRQAKSESAGDASSDSAKEASSTTVVEEPAAEVVQEETETPAPTLETARALAVDLAKAKGRAGLLDVLTSFGAAGVSALQPDQIADFCDAVRESLAA